MREYQDLHARGRGDLARLVGPRVIRIELLRHLRTVDALEESRQIRLDDQDVRAFCEADQIRVRPRVAGDDHGAAAGVESISERRLDWRVLFLEGRDAD